MSTPVDDGGPAFPIVVNHIDDTGGASEMRLEHEGMTLRDWFAGQALQGLIAASAPIPDGETEEEFDEIPYIVREAFRAADVMLAQRKKPCS